ncbi:MAG: PilZ domain-containing protein [Proteobacteria bacterium]|nr:PilZ domain-containing protein [Pseudomonadota bacterium]
MALLKEKRLHERYDHETDIIYSCEGENCFNNAKLFNSSRGGMYFNSKYELSYGADVCIKMNRFRAIFDAKVVRCLEINDGDDICYGIGIKLFEPTE